MTTSTFSFHLLDEKKIDEMHLPDEDERWRDEKRKMQMHPSGGDAATVMQMRRGEQDEQRQI